MAGYIYPGQCITLGFRVRLLMRAIAPIVLILAIPVGRIAFVYGRLAVQKMKDLLGLKKDEHAGPLEVVSTRSPLIDALYVAVPFALL